MEPNKGYIQVFCKRAYRSANNCKRSHWQCAHIDHRGGTWWFFANNVAGVTPDVPELTAKENGQKTHEATHNLRSTGTDMFSTVAEEWRSGGTEEERISESYWIADGADHKHFSERPISSEICHHFML